MITCQLCRGHGERYDYVVEATLVSRCTNCDGTGKVAWAGGWRPFEPSQETVEAAQPRSCNLHSDCDAADEKVKAEGGRPARCDGWEDGRYVRAGERVHTAFHCSSEDCEDCFGC